VLIRKQKGFRRPRTEDLEALSEALKEIEAQFQMMGFSSGKREASQGETGDEEQEYADEDEYGEGEDAGGAAFFQREDVEVAVDVFLSELVREGIIKKYKRGKPPSLEKVFEQIFGEKHEVVKVVHVFEEHIEGYFDLIGYEDMEAAFGELADIRDILDKELVRYAAK
jgi:hypothetical protein